jgi:glycosyltransferase involved in cell wall biosynthesis
MSAVVFVTVVDMSRRNGSGIATGELVTALGRQTTEEFHVICPIPGDRFPDSVTDAVDTFHLLPAETDPGSPRWHGRVELATLHRLLSLVRKERPSLVVTRLSPSTLFPAPVCRLFDIPHVVLIRGMINRDDRYGRTKYGRIVEQVVHLNVRLADEVYVAFEAIRREVEQYRRAAQPPIQVLPNAADPEVFVPRSVDTCRQEVGVAYDGFLLGFVGSLAPRQMLPESLRGLARTDDGQLLVVGDGPLRGELTGLARELGIPDRVRFTGRVPNEAIPAYICACDATYGVVNPDRPSNPVKCYESLACGRPVITSPSPELSFVEEVDAGIVLPEITPREVATAIRELRDVPPEQRRAMGERGREYVVAQHTWDAVAETILRDNLPRSGADI